MEIKEAIEIAAGRDESASVSDIFRAKYLIFDAIRNGYTLCRVEEAIENIKSYSKMMEYANMKQNTILTQEAVDCIREACE